MKKGEHVMKKDEAVRHLKFLREEVEDIRRSMNQGEPTGAWANRVNSDEALQLMILDELREISDQLRRVRGDR